MNIADQYTKISKLIEIELSRTSVSMPENARLEENGLLYVSKNFLTKQDALKLALFINEIYGERVNL